MTTIQKHEYDNDIFCDKCDNILDISKSVSHQHAKELDSATPSVVSSESDNMEDGDDIGGDINNDINDSIDDNIDDNIDDSIDDEDDGVDYETILKKIEANIKPTDDEIYSINIKNMVKNKYYKKMQKKGDIKKNIIIMMDELDNADDNIQAYMMCKNCGHNKKINTKFCVFKKNSEGESTVNDYVNFASYRNKVHVRTIPSTRNFECPNLNCQSHGKNVPSEASFFRKNANSYEIIYVCKNCLTIRFN